MPIIALIAILVLCFASPVDAARCQFIIREPGTYSLLNLATKPGWAAVEYVIDWNEIEDATLGVYDWTEVDDAYLAAVNAALKVRIQLRTTQFTAGGNPKTPSYMWTNSSYGGTPGHYGNYPRTATSPPGWYANICDADVRTRYKALMTALGNHIVPVSRGGDGVTALKNDANFFGIIGGETAMASDATYCPPASLNTAVRAIPVDAVDALGTASLFTQHFNFGTAFLGGAAGLVDFIDDCATLGVNVGCPDTFWEYNASTGCPTTCNSLLCITTFPNLADWYGTAVKVIAECQTLDYTKSNCYNTGGAEITVQQVLDQTLGITHSVTKIGADYLVWVYVSGEWADVLSVTEEYYCTPEQATLSSPANDAPGLTLPVTLASNAYAVPTNCGTHTHSHSQWQISTSSAFTEMVSTTPTTNTADSSNKLSITITAGLSNGVTYYWRVRHRENTDDWGEWSASRMFLMGGTSPTGSGGAVTIGSGTGSATLTGSGAGKGSMTLTGPP